MAALLCQTRQRNLESPVLGHWREAEERSGRSTGGMEGMSVKCPGE